MLFVDGGAPNSHSQALATLLGNPDTVRRFRRDAERHARLSRGSEHAAELLSEAVAAVLADADPLDETIEERLAREVRRCAQQFRRRERLRRRQFTSLDEAPELTPRDDGLQRLVNEGLPKLRNASAITDRIRTLAVGDPRALRIFELMLGDSEMNWRDAGMSRKAFRSARDRLVNYAKLAVAMQEAWEQLRQVRDRDAGSVGARVR